MLMSFALIATCFYCSCPLCLAIKLNIYILKMAYRSGKKSTMSLAVDFTVERAQIFRATTTLMKKQY